MRIFLLGASRFLAVFMFVSALVANKHFILQVCYPVRRG